jgi:hypothetical protein
MNSVNRQKKEVVMRSLAVAGLIALICLIAWLSVQIVRVAPAAFSSLASLAEGISRYEDTLSKSDEPRDLFIHEAVELVDSGNQVNLSWDKPETQGSFTLSYACTDGVTLSVLNEEGVRDLECGLEYSLGDRTEVKVIPESTTKRYVDVTYNVSYNLPENNALHSRGSAILTITNRDILDTNNEGNDDVTFGSDDVITSNETSSDVVTPTDSNVGTQVNVPTYQFQYKIPVSNPNGYTDLRATYIGVGTIVNGKFVTKDLRQDTTGAIQFEVKNIGNKTSAGWTFTVTLPDGTTYNSGKQESLKPNERAVFTIGMQTGDDDSHTFKVVVTTDNDIVKANNSFSKVVTIKD